LLSIKEEAYDQSERFTGGFIDFSIWSSTLIYLLFALVSAFSFGRAIQGNIFTSYPNDSAVFIIGRGLYAIMALVSVPLLTHPAKASLVHLINGAFDESVVTLAVLTATILTGIFVSNLKQVHNFQAPLLTP